MSFLDWPVSIPNPSYGWYRADSQYWNSTSELLYDISGKRNHASLSGVIQLRTGSGNGATASIQYLKGGRLSTVEWPTGSIPSEFTVCSVTRYVMSGTMGRILAGKTVNWYHGHHANNRGVAYYGILNTYHVSVGLLTDWLVMCGRNTGSKPNNIFVDGVAAGYWTGGSGSSVLGINISPTYENSDWEFRELMIWNTSLSDAEMVTVSTALRVSLLYGKV